MAIELINIGRIANDGTGDDLREAFTKVNRSLEDLDLRIDDKTEGLNLGAGAGVFKVRNGYDLEFRTLLSGDSINITQNVNNITIDLDTTVADRSIIADSGAMTVPARQAIRFNGAAGITTSVDQVNNTVNIAGDVSLASDTNPTLNHSLNANQNDIINADLIVANNVQSNVHGLDIRELNKFFTTFDLGDLDNLLISVDNFFDYIRKYQDIDLGALPTVSNVNLDFGQFTSP